MEQLNKMQIRNSNNSNKVRLAICIHTMEYILPSRIIEQEIYDAFSREDYIYTEDDMVDEEELNDKVKIIGINKNRIL